MVCFVELDLVEEADGIVPASKCLMLQCKFIYGLAMTSILFTDRASWATLTWSVDKLLYLATVTYVINQDFTLYSTLCRRVALPS